MKIITIYLIVLMTLGLFADEKKSAKFIFLMVGDGMGMTHRNIAEYYKRAMDDDINLKETKYNNGLIMNSFPIQSLCSTYSESSIVTDSAAAATAFATGHKTKSGVISMDVNGQKPYETIAEIALRRGMKVGIVTSVSIDHATPAAFYSHHPSRGMYYDISLDISRSGFHYFGGGQAKKMWKNQLNGKKSPIDYAQEAGYFVVTNKEQFYRLEPLQHSKVWACAENVTSAGALKYAIDRLDNTNSLTLVDFTKKGIELLDNPDGFFLMVEGGKIDWASHENDIATMVHEVLEFDKAVATAYDFYMEHPEDTLIVVIGDHETGGLSFGNQHIKYAAFPDKINSQKVSQKQFAKTVKTFKKNKLTFEEALPQIKNAFGFLKLSDAEINIISNGYARTMADNKNYDDKIKYGNYDPLCISCGRVLGNRSGLAWTTFAHTGVPIQVSVIGVGQENFNGMYDNTDIFKKIYALLPK